VAKRHNKGQVKPARQSTKVAIISPT